ncbi:hypothetical protein RIF29_07655 [Crotalaria pallida]|uniref:Uncharacterized protein n=1 Tax=Crotalaria pallida TaxID=3830 RepID=A0AAN9J4K2_CROPI
MIVPITVVQVEHSKDSFSENPTPRKPGSLSISVTPFSRLLCLATPLLEYSLPSSSSSFFFFKKKFVCSHSSSLSLLPSSL